MVESSPDGQSDARKLSRSHRAEKKVSTSGYLNKNDELTLANVRGSAFDALPNDALPNKERDLDQVLPNKERI